MDLRTEYSLKAALVRLFWQRYCWRWLHEKLNRLEYTVFLFSLVSAQFKLDANTQVNNKE